MAHFYLVQYADYYRHILVHLLLINILVSATVAHFFMWLVRCHRLCVISCLPEQHLSGIQNVLLWCWPVLRIRIPFYGSGSSLKSEHGSNPGVFFKTFNNIFKTAESLKKWWPERKSTLVLCHKESGSVFQELILIQKAIKYGSRSETSGIEQRSIRYGTERVQFFVS